MSDVYVALLRGIMPQNPNMANANLRRVMTDLGFDQVATVISSGNIVFAATTAHPADDDQLAALIEPAWESQLGFRSTTIVRSRARLAEFAAGSPFAAEPDAKSSSQQVTFFRSPPATLDLAVLDAPPGCQFVGYDGQALCTAIDHDVVGTPDLMRWLERTFSKEITTRTFKTVGRILAKMG